MLNIEFNEKLVKEVKIKKSNQVGVRNLTFAKRAIDKVNNEFGYTLFVIKNDKNTVFTIRRMYQGNVDNTSKAFFNHEVSESDQSKIESFIKDNIDI